MATSPVVRNPWLDVLDVAGLNSVGNVNVNGNLSVTGTITGTVSGSVDAANITGILPINHGGTNLSAVGAGLRYLRSKANSLTPTLEYAQTWGVNPLDYVFSISPGVDLGAGAPVTITIPYGPLGVNGSDANHYLYLSGGTGTAEAVLITGGTCASGALASCTLSFTPANAHTGAWAIGSASSGIQEALIDNGNVLVPHGANLAVQATITPPNNSSITGVNEGASIITFLSTNTEFFHVIHDRFAMRNLALIQSGTPAAGNVGIRTYGPLGTIVGGCQWADFEHLYVVGFYNNIIAEGNGQLLNGNFIQATNAISDSIVLNGIQGYWGAVTSQGAQGNGFTIGVAPGFGPTIAFMSNIQTFNNAGWGISTTAALTISGGNSFFNNDKLGEILINDTMGGSSTIADANFQFAGHSLTWGDLNTAPGVHILSTNAGPVRIQNCDFAFVQGNGLVTEAGLIKVLQSRFAQCGLGGQTGAVYGIAMSPSADCAFIGNTGDAPWLLNGNRMIVTSNNIQVNNATLDAVNISGGADVIFDDNYVSQAGAGRALSINAGVTYQHGNNTVIGTLVNSGAASANSRAL